MDGLDESVRLRVKMGVGVVGDLDEDGEGRVVRGVNSSLCCVQFVCLSVCGSDS